MSSGDRIVLTIPRDEGFEDVAQLVLGGVASRLNLSYESFDDLGTGVAALLERRDDDAALTVQLDVGDGLIATLIGPFRGDAIRRELEHPDGGVTLRRVLETVVDEFQALERPDGNWVELRKRIETRSGS
jgi:hypothetical protein